VIIKIHLHHINWLFTQKYTDISGHGQMAERTLVFCSSKCSVFERLMLGSYSLA